MAAPNGWNQYTRYGPSYAPILDDMSASEVRELIRIIQEQEKRESPKQKPVRKCHICGEDAATLTNDGRYWCNSHTEQEKARRRAAASLAWIEQAFRTTKPELRKKLYRALSTVFHPDAGGEESIMIVLNSIYERFS